MKSLQRIACALLMAVAANAIHAQSTSARIVGTVTDASGAVQPGVSVKVTNIETNAVRTITTDETGDYSVLNLPIGNYEVAAEAAGFKRYVQRPIKLDVDQTARIDVKMDVGQVTESVTVEGSAPLIESERSSLGQVIENKTIVQIPLNGRNFIRLGSLMPGTTEGAPGNSVVRDRQGGVALTANGQRAEHNNFMLDGTDNNATLAGTAVVIPSVDAIQEFKVQTANYSAEFGRGAGAIVNVAIKSGTNELHGTLYEFIRNDIFDASNTFAAIDPATGERTKNPLRRNQFGGTIGGPVELSRAVFGPLAYAGRNRTFFFFNYEGLRERRGFTGRFNVPTAAQRNGDFTGAPTVYDPLNVVGGARVAFADNRIPAARINPITRRILELIPLPNSTDPAANYIRQFSNPTDNNQYHVRGDHAFTANDQLKVRYSQTEVVATNRTLNFNGDSTAIKTKGGVIGYTHIFSPTTINEFNFGTQRYAFDLTPEGIGEDFTSPLGLPTFGATGNFLRYPTITLLNLTAFGGNTALPVLRAENSFQFIDTLSFVLGKHSLRAGGDIRRYQLNNFQPQFSSGNYNFTGAFTGIRAGVPYATGLADFLLGFPATEAVLNPTGFDANRIRNTRSSLFIQDDYQVAARLTLNLGLRWERDGAWREKDDRWAYFDFAAGQLVYPRTAQTPFTTLPYPSRFDDIKDIKRPQNKMFAPRVGFAFRPFADNKTVVRGAYGIFWGQPLGFLVLNTAVTPPPFNLRQTATSGTTTPQLQFGVFPGVTPSTLIPTNPGGVFTLNPETFINGYVQQWNFGIERELFGNIGVKASYVGNKGTHLERRIEANPALPPVAGAINPRRRYPLFQSIVLQNSESYSTYHSLQLSAEKRFSRGLLFLAGYTWSKALDDSSSWSGLGGQESNLPQDPSRVFLEKARAGSDLRQRFTFTFVYELPFHAENRALNALISGWQASGILTVRTGYPFTVIVGGDIPNAGTGHTRANLVGDPSARRCANEGDCWFNTAAFVAPAPFTFGTSGRNILDGPGARAFDFAALRVFNFTERHQLQLRAEFFNALNHPVYGLPGTQVGAANYGLIRSASNREMQFALKYIF